jgi:alpha-tubulin suppressor-like RCC1 family protein
VNFALTCDGCAYAWGSNANGNIGDGTIDDKCCPVAICTTLRFKQIKPYSALDCCGNAYSWGVNIGGSGGNGTSGTTYCCPVAVCGGLKFRQLTFNNYHVTGITDSGCLYSWGGAQCGGLGDGTITNKCCPVSVCGPVRGGLISQANRSIVQVTPNQTYQITVQGFYLAFAGSPVQSLESGLVLEYWA